MTAGHGGWSRGWGERCGRGEGQLVTRAVAQGAPGDGRGGGASAAASASRQASELPSGGGAAKALTLWVGRLGACRSRTSLAPPVAGRAAWSCLVASAPAARGVLRLAVHPSRPCSASSQGRAVGRIQGDLVCFAIAPPAGSSLGAMGFGSATPEGGLGGFCNRRPRRSSTEGLPPGAGRFCLAARLSHASWRLSPAFLQPGQPK